MTGRGSGQLFTASLSANRPFLLHAIPTSLLSHAQFTVIGCLRIMLSPFPHSAGMRTKQR